MAFLMERHNEPARTVDIGAERAAVDANMLSEKVPVTDAEPFEAANRRLEVLQILVSTHDSGGVYNAVPDLDQGS
jgi:hypothetical protein